jgi:radical SAM superfamily enzyme YgiQ (UPF0313 family)
VRALLINPAIPDTFWSLHYALPILASRATIPPLNLLTVAAMMPRDWSITLVDLNCRSLDDDHLKAADLVFIGGMSIQIASANDVIRRCRDLGVKVCGGGVMFGMDPEAVQTPDYLLLGEVEEVFPLFVEDLAQGRPQAMYRAQRFPDLALTPPPRWDILNLSDYLTMAVQVSRGCPHDCDFCHVTILNGRRPRYKSTCRVLDELTALYLAGWRGPVMFVDDNFIGNREAASRLLLDLIHWQEERKYPFIFLSQASLEVADQPRLLELLQRAGFVQLFLGIETPSLAALKECGKTQNVKRNLAEAVGKIQAASIDVLGGFIVGFDADTPAIFEEMARFIEASSISTAMVGALAAPPGTRLFERLEGEGRLLGQSDGDSIANLKGMNVRPRMGMEALLKGYCELLQRLYDPEPYYRRVRSFLAKTTPNPYLPFRLPTAKELRIFVNTIRVLGVKDPDRRHFWRFMLRCLPRVAQLPLAVSMAIGGYHYRQVVRRFVGECEQVGRVGPVR